MKRDLLSPPPPVPSAWRLAAAAAWANLVPGLILQTVLLAVVLTYYFLEPMRGAWGEVARLKEESGYLFALFSGALAGGVLPEILKIGAIQNGKILRRNLENLVFYPMFWGGQAVMVDAFYRLQAFWFGDRAEVTTILKKVLVDQLVYTPLLALPTGLLAVTWWENDRSGSAVREVFSVRGLREKAFPSLVANLAVWLPAVSLVYAIPARLQVPVYAVALSFWVLLFTWINAGPSTRRS